MAASDGEDSYVEPPLSQLEIPYKMNFSSSEDEAKKKKSRKPVKGNKRKRTLENDSSNSDSDDSSSSSSCVSFDSNPDRKVTNREPLRVNDIITYTPPVFTIGTHVKQAVVLGIWPANKSFPLILDNADMLPWDTSIQRIGEFFQGQIYKHSGRIKPISSFRLQQGGTKDVTIGLRDKASTFKKMLQDMQQRAMATLRGEIKSPSKLQSTPSSQKKSIPKQSSTFESGSKPISSARTDTDRNKKKGDSASTSSASSSGLSAMLKPQSKATKTTATRKPVAATLHSKPNSSDPKSKTSIEFCDDSSSSSSNESTTLEKLKPRGYRNKRLSLTKTNAVKSPAARCANRQPKPKHLKPMPNNKKADMSLALKSTKENPISVDSSSDDDPLLVDPKKARARDSRKKTASKEDKPESPAKRAFPPSVTTNLNDDTDSDNENKPTYDDVLSKRVLSALEMKRKERPSFPRAETILYSGSESETDIEVSGIHKTLESRQQQGKRKVLEGKDSLCNLPEAGNNSSTGGAKSTTAKSRAKTTYSSKELDSSSSSGESKTLEKPKIAQTKTMKKKTELPKLPQGQMTNAELGLGSEDSSDDEDLLRRNPPAFAKRMQSPKKQALYNRTNQKQNTAAGIGYDADEDSENEDALRAKSVWMHNHSSERNVTPSKKSRSKESHKASPSSSKKAFPKSPTNESRSRLVENILRHKSTPSPAKSSKQSTNQRQELSVSSSDSDDSDESRRRRTKQKQRQHKRWSSDDSSIDSPTEEDAYIPTPSSKRDAKSHDASDGGRAKKRQNKDDFEFLSSDDNKPSQPKKIRRLSPKSRKNVAVSSTKISSLRHKSRPQTAHGRNRRKQS